MVDVEHDFFADWIALDPLALPDPKRGPYLVTNNPKSRNAFGWPTHVFLVAMFHATAAPKCEVTAFEGHRQIWGCELYKPVFTASGI